MARNLLAGFELDAPVRLLGIGVGGLAAVTEERKGTPEGAAALANEPLALDL